MASQPILDEHGEVLERTSAVKRRATIAAAEFPDDATKQRFYAALAKAQDALQTGRYDHARRCCLLALRIRPHAEVMALLEAVSEARGDFAAAREFRLLKALLSRDVVLWQELYQDYMAAAEFHRAVMCLKRMAALESDAARQRQLHLDRAELLVELGVLSQATTAYKSLWEGSKHTDFAVFAQMASLFFQTGRHAALGTEVRKAKAGLIALADKEAKGRDATDSEEAPEEGAPKKRRRGGPKAPQRFDPKAFMTIVNIECELAAERGDFTAVIDATYDAARRLKVAVTALHPDVLVRLGVALAMLGRAEEAASAFDRVVLYAADAARSSWSTADDRFADVLYDAAEALLKVDQAAHARRLYAALAKDPELSADSAAFVAVRLGLGRCAESLGDITVAMREYNAVLGVAAGNVAARRALARVDLELGDVAAAAGRLQPRDDDDPFDVVHLRRELALLLWGDRDAVGCITAALPVFETLLFVEGDEESVATGASRRTTRTLTMPTLLRATSVIVPATQLQANVSSGAASAIGGSFAAQSIAASFAASAIARTSVAASRQGTLSTAASGTTAIGAGQASPGELFQFFRKRKPKKGGAGPQPAEAAGGKRPREEEGPKQAGKEDEVAPWDAPAAAPVRSGDDDVANLDDLAEMEALLGDDDASPVEAPPSLEAVAQGFDDPEMAALFLAATEGTKPAPPAPSVDTPPGAGEQGLGSAGPTQMTQGAGAERTMAAMSQLREAQTAALKLRGPTRDDVLQLLGHDGVVGLLVAVSDAYSSLGQGADAKELLYRVLMVLRKRRRRMTKDVLVQLDELHLRLALETGDFRNAIRRVREVLTQGEPSPKVWDTVAAVVNSLALLSPTDGCGVPILRRLLRDCAATPLLTILGGYFLHRHSFPLAIGHYAAAYAANPDDPQLCLTLGLAYLLSMRHKSTPLTHLHGHAATVLALFARYAELSAPAAGRDELIRVEVAYNMGRVYHGLAVWHHALPLYSAALELSVAAPQRRQLSAKDLEWLQAVRRAAAANTAYIYGMTSANAAMAEGVLRDHFSLAV